MRIRIRGKRPYGIQFKCAFELNKLIGEEKFRSYIETSGISGLLIYAGTKIKGRYYVISNLEVSKTITILIRLKRIGVVKEKKFCLSKKYS